MSNASAIESLLTISNGGNSNEVNITALSILIDGIKSGLDNFMLCCMGAIVWTMQSGFACLEAGACRSKHVTSILFKVLAGNFVCGIAYWLVGYAFAYGEPSNAFIGYSYFLGIGGPNGKLSHWVFQYVFAAVACTIVSGAIAERMETVAYLIITAFIGGFVYPVYSHWVWAETGWLYINGYHDFAGSSVVHILGATCSLTCALILGPRAGRFTNEAVDEDFKGHSMPLTVMGGFILFFGFLAFNGGSVGTITKQGDGEIMARAMVITIVMGSTGAIGSLLVGRTFSCEAAVNGALAAMVAACAGCNQFEMWAGAVIGLFAAAAYILLAWVIPKLKVDDPTSAIAVHFAGGVVGELAVPIFSFEYGFIHFGNSENALYNLGWQVCGFVAVIVWCSVLVGSLCFILRLAGILRVPVEAEEEGLDIYRHHEPAYKDIYDGSRAMRAFRKLSNAIKPRSRTGSDSNSQAHQPHRPGGLANGSDGMELNARGKSFPAIQE